MAEPKIKYDIEAAVSGDASVQALEKHLRELGDVMDGDLSKGAKDAADAIQQLGAKQAAVVNMRQLTTESGALAAELQEAEHTAQQLGQQLAETATKTQQLAAAEAQARAALEATRAAQERERAALRALKADNVGAARSAEEYRQRKAALQAEGQRLAAQLALERAALKSAEAQAKTAQQAHASLSAQYEASAAALMRSRTAQLDVNAALSAGQQRLRAVGIDTSDLAAAERNLSNAMAAARAEALQILPAYARLTQETQKAGAAQEKTGKTYREGLASISAQLQNVQNIAAMALGGGYAMGLLSDVMATADAFSNLQARVKLATGEGQTFERGFEGVKRVALETHSALEGTGTLFARIVQAGKEFALSQQASLSVTKSINQAIQLSGGSAASADAAITQLIQGLQSGVLRGEEFNSVMEQAPRLARALADGLGVTTGELRKMAGEGALTSKVVISALQSQRATLEAEFKTLPATVGRAITDLQNRWMLFVGEMDKSSGVSGYVAAGITSLANNLDTLARVAGMAGAALTASLAVQGAAALRAYAAEAAVAAGATNVLAASIARVPRMINIAVAVTGFEIGYQFGTMLYENSELAKKFGVGLVGYFEVVVSSLRLAKEAAAAVFTSDTVDAAYQRFQARNETIRTQIAEMMRDAEQAPTKVGAAASAASDQLAGMGAAATAAGAALTQGGAEGARGIAHVGTAADEARAKLAGLARAINAKPATDGGLKGVIRDLEEASLRSENLDLQLRKNLPEAIEKLSGPELAKFRSEFIVAMDGAKKALEDAIKADKPKAEIDKLQAKVDAFEKATRTGLGLIAQQAAKNLGVDVPLAFNKISSSFRQSQDDLSVLIRSLPELKAEGVDTAAVVGQALSQMIDGAQNEAELEAIRGRVQALRGELGEKIADGLLDEAKKKAEQLQDALDAATPGINSVREAFKELGIESDAALKDKANKAKEAYDAIKRSGTASAREINESWKAMAEASIKANNGMADSTVKAQAKAHGFAIETDAAGKSIVKSLGEAKGAAKGVGDALGAAGDEGRDALGKIDYGAKVAGKSMEELNKITAKNWDANRDLADQAAEHNAAANESVNAWMKTQQEGNKYYKEMIEILQKTRMGYADMNDAAWAAANALEALDKQQEALNRSNADGARGLQDLQMRLLELSGNEEAVAELRKARDEAEIQKKMALLQLDLQRAQIKKNDEEAALLAAELAAYQKQLQLLDEVYKKERKLREEKARQERKAAADARKQNAQVHEERMVQIEEESQALQEASTEQADALKELQAAEDEARARRYEKEDKAAQERYEKERARIEAAEKARQEALQRENEARERAAREQERLEALREQERVARQEADRQREKAAQDQAERERAAREQAAQGRPAGRSEQEQQAQDRKRDAVLADQAAQAAEQEQLEKKRRDAEAAARAARLQEQQEREAAARAAQEQAAQAAYQARLQALDDAEKARQARVTEQREREAKELQAQREREEKARQASVQSDGAAQAPAQQSGGGVQPPGVGVQQPSLSDQSRRTSSSGGSGGNGGASPGRVVTVNLALGGQTLGTVVTDDAGAGSIEKFMRSLEAGRRATGR